MEPQRNVLDNFIVLEGLDGSGTTTQTELLTERLVAEGAAVVSTCEPSAGPIGVLLRRMLRHELRVDPCTLAMLFAADRNEHLYSPSEGIVHQLEAGRIVVCDRYLFSSLAYQSIGCSYRRVAQLNAPFPLPRYLIFLDVEPAECQRRLATRAGIELFEDAGMQEQILHNYEQAMAGTEDRGMELIRVDGSEAIDRVSEKIWSSLASLPIQKV